MNKLTIEDLQVKGKKVLVRVDFNVPMDENRNITDDTRIRAAVPTIKYLSENGAKVILMSHMGRPKGEKKAEFSLKPVAEHLAGVLGKAVAFATDCIGLDAETAVAALNDGDIVLLENLRYYNEETKNNEDFAKKLAALGEIYVNDAFGTAHRAHASTHGVTAFIKECAAGYLLQKEIQYLGMALADPKRPFVAILGGSKVSGKIDVIMTFLDKVNVLLIGGGMAYTFKKALGGKIGKSLCEDDKLELAKDILKKAEVKGCKNSSS